MKPAPLVAQKWIEESDSRFQGHEMSEIAANGRAEWIVQERSFSPFLDKDRAAQSATLESFRSMQQGWDSYDAEPPSDAAIANAKLVLHVLWSSEIAPPVRQISPSVEGGVAVVFTGRDKKYADLECFNNGDILAIISDGTSEPEVWSLNKARGDIRHAIEKLNAFFNG